MEGSRVDFDELLAFLRSRMAAKPDRTAVDPTPMQRGMQALDEALGRRAETESRIPEGTQPWIRDLYTSPMADSTYRMVGMPEVLNELPERMYAQAAARVSAKGDTLSMHPYRDLWDGAYNLRPVNSRDPRETFLHEQGHRYMLPERGEGLADAFRGAFDVLSKTGTDTTGMGEMLDAAERRDPGTRAMSRKLLKEPLFADHPAAGGKGGKRMAALDQLLGLIPVPPTTK